MSPYLHLLFIRVLFIYARQHKRAAAIQYIIKARFAPEPCEVIAFEVGAKRLYKARSGLCSHKGIADDRTFLMMQGMGHRFLACGKLRLVKQRAYIFQAFKIQVHKYPAHFKQDKIAYRIHPLYGGGIAVVYRQETRVVVADKLPVHIVGP